MNKKAIFFNKTLVIGLLVLFIGVAIAPSINANINKKNNYFKVSDYNCDNPESDIEPLFWWNLWPNLPGRYEPMFDVHDVIDLGQTAWGLSSADFNNDGLLDFAVSWATSPWTQSTISVFYNDGVNRYIQNNVYTIITPLRYFNDLNSGDYDLDGDIDLMFTYDDKNNKTGTVNLLLNDGNNNFNDPIMIAYNIPIDERKRINPQITSADFDNDGDIDFLIGDNSGLVEFYKNDGTGSFSSAGLYDFSFMSWGLSSADFDNDGDIDFIVTQAKDDIEGYIYVVWNDGTSSCFNQSNSVKIADLPPRPSFFAGVILGFGYLQSIDYNDDGMMDFIFSGGDSVFLYMQQDIGVFNYFHIMRLPGRNAEDGGWYLDDLRLGGIAIGDFNGDDLDDMVIGGVQGVVRICYNKFVLVDIVHPDSANLFVGNIEVWQIGLLAPIMIYHFLKNGISIAVGDLTVEAKALEPLQKVEFYIGLRKIYTDDSEPFEWEWKSFSFRRCKVKAIGYDLDGNKVGFDDAIVWKFF